MIGWLIALAVIVGLAIMPLGVAARYDEDGPLLRLIVGPIRATVFPSKKQKKEKKKKEKPEKPEKQEASAQKSKTEKKGGSVTDFLPLVELVWEFLSDFKSKLRVNNLELKLILAGDDPCDLAVNYGRAWAALGNLVPMLERFFVIKKRDMEVECDFTADKTLIFARLELTITFGRLLKVGFYHGFRILRKFLTIMKSRKGGATQ